MGAFLPTGGDTTGGDISNSGLVIGAVFPALGAALQIAGFLMNFAEWIASFFEGVPHEAKTEGLGIQLLKHPDPITAFLGANLVDGAKVDRVISESTGAHSFEAITGTLTQQLYELQNQYPFGEYWQSIIDAFGRPAWQIKGVPPPEGSPYTAPVDFVGIILTTRVPTAYAAIYGAPPPSPDVMLRFLNSGTVPTWRQFATGANDFPALQRAIGDAVKSAWQSFLVSAGAGGGTGGGGLPGGDTWVDNPEDDELVNGLNHLISLLRQASGGGNPDPVTCAQVTSAAGALGDALGRIAEAITNPEGKGGAGVNITPIADDLANLTATLERLINADPVTCAQITSAAATIANAIAAGGPDDPAGLVGQLKRIADALQPDPASDAKVKQMAQYLVDQGLIDSQLGQIIIG